MESYEEAYKIVYGHKKVLKENLALILCQMNRKHQNNPSILPERQVSDLQMIGEGLEKSMMQELN